MSQGLWHGAQRFMVYAMQMEEGMYAVLGLGSGKNLDPSPRTPKSTCRLSCPMSAYVLKNQNKNSESIQTHKNSYSAVVQLRTLSGIPIQHSELIRFY